MQSILSVVVWTFALICPLQLHAAVPIGGQYNIKLTPKIKYKTPLDLSTLSQQLDLNVVKVIHLPSGWLVIKANKEELVKIRKRSDIAVVADTRQLPADG